MKPYLEGFIGVNFFYYYLKKIDLHAMVSEDGLDSREVVK
jgi:hypothetical protein